MIINPFIKESTRNKLLKFLPVLVTKCEYISNFVQENIDLIEVNDKLSQMHDIEVGTEVLIISKEKVNEFYMLFEEFDSYKSMALEWLEDIRPFLLEDKVSKDVYAICDNKLAIIFIDYNKIVSFINQYEMFTVDP